MTWELRGRIFARMMAFARKAAFTYSCIHADKNFMASGIQLLDAMENRLRMLVAAVADRLREFECVKIYYDGGQSAITNMLHRAFGQLPVGTVAFAQDVRPEKYKLFQVADLLCTVELARLKMEAGAGLSKSESHFFGGPRAFARNIVRPLRRKRFPPPSRAPKPRWSKEASPSMIISFCYVDTLY